MRMESNCGGPGGEQMKGDHDLALVSSGKTESESE